MNSIQNPGRKKFASLSKSECANEYISILANSDQCWASGEYLAEKNDYGRAMSLAIISVEELIKCIVIFLDSKGFRFRQIKGIGVIFKTHQIRYIVAFVMFCFTIFGDDLLRFLQKTFKPDKKTNAEELKALLSDKKKLEKQASAYTLRKIVQISKEIVWFSKVDVLRQNGFYCDYDQQLVNPVHINETAYLEVKLKLSAVRFFGKQFMEIANNEAHAEVNYLLNEFNDKNLYQKIEALLAKHKGNNLFELIEKKISRN